MKNLPDLKDIKKEVHQMEFNYKNVHRIMYLVYETQQLITESFAIPNKDIALHQVNKIIAHELLFLIKSAEEDDIKKAFTQLIDSFNLVLTYVA